MTEYRFLCAGQRVATSPRLWNAHCSAPVSPNAGVSRLFEDGGVGMPPIIISTQLTMLSAIVFTQEDVLLQKPKRKVEDWIFP